MFDESAAANYKGSVFTVLSFLIGLPVVRKPTQNIFEENYFVNKFPNLKLVINSRVEIILAQKGCSKLLVKLYLC